MSCLAPDREGAGIAYEEIRRKLINFFARQGCVIPEDLADETINRVAGKIMQGTRIWTEHPVSYFYGVAWNVLLDHRRYLHRASVPLDGIDESLCFEDPFEVEEGRRTRQQLEQLLQGLDACLEDLPQHWRDLILEYHGSENSRVENRKQQAERMGIPSNALRIRACRIRAKLKELISAWLERAVI